MDTCSVDVEKNAPEHDGLKVSLNSVLNGNVDIEYYKGYSSIEVHEEMLSDTIRTNAYRYAILKNYPHLYKHTALDVGAGTGILSIFAAQAGAKKVYAVEASEMAVHMRRVVKENNMEHKIDVIQSIVEDVQLPEKVDVIISEWMGYCLLYESMLPSVLAARDKFLKPGGLMFPCHAALYLAPVHDENYLERIHLWKDMKSLYKVSMESMIPVANSRLTGDADIIVISPESVMAHATKVCSFDLSTVTREEIENIQSNFTFKCFGHSTITGFVTWFIVEFPGGTTLSTSPYDPETHWGQTTFYLQQSFPVEQDTHIEGKITLRPHLRNRRFLEVKLDFAVDGKDVYQQTFSLDNGYT